MELDAKLSQFKIAEVSKLKQTSENKQAKTRKLKNKEAKKQGS
jgi:hypothetical protein